MKLPALSESVFPCWAQFEKKVVENIISQTFYSITAFLLVQNLSIEESVLL